MSFIEWFVSNPVKVSVGVIMLAMFGSIAMYRMPMQLTPEVEVPAITVMTTWPGASPQEVETEIVQEQEEQLQSVEGLQKMSSESSDSNGKITLEFAIGTPNSEALLNVNTRLGQVREYPENADQPIVASANANDKWIAWFALSPLSPQPEKLDEAIQKFPQFKAEIEHVKRALNSGLAILRMRELADKHSELAYLRPNEEDLTKLRRFCEEVIEPRLERVPGVSNSDVFGGREEELQVVVDPHQLAARQLTIADMREALRKKNRDTSAGDVAEGKRRWVVRTIGKFTTKEEVEHTILAHRDGDPVYVRDVAEVRIGYKKAAGIVRRYGTSVIALNAQRKTGSNVLEVMQGLQQTVKELNAGVLKQRGLELTQVYDETEYINSSIGVVKDDILLGSVLTFIVLLVFLRSVRSSFVILLAIATSMIGMFLMLSFMGRTLNVLTLAGISFAVGMLVDNFIVVLESIFRHRAEGDDILTATVKGTNEVWGAIIASTLANLAVFVPILFVQDQVGQLFRDLALAVSSALMLSLLVALIVVPTAAGRLLKSATQPAAGETGEGAGAEPSRLHTVFGLLPLLDSFGRRFVELVVRINEALQASLRLRLITVLGFLGASIGLSYVLMPGVEYLPGGNRNFVIAVLLPPPGYNIDHVQTMAQRVEAIARPYWDIDLDDPKIKDLDYPPLADFFFVAQGKMLFLGASSLDPLQAHRDVPLLQQWVSVFPGTFGFASQMSLFESGLTAGRSIDIEITGPELTKLVGLGGRIFGQAMQVVPGCQAVPVPSLDLSSPEVHALPRWEQAADLGLGADEIGYAVDALVDGAYATDFYIGGDKIDLSIMGQEQFALRTQDLESLPIATRTGQVVSLGAVADLPLRSGPEQINRRERQRAITIRVTPPAETPIELAMANIQSEIVQPLINEGTIGTDYQINLSGTADKLRTTWLAIRWNLLLAVVITYLVIAALFESWIYPFIVMMSVPLGAVGGFAGLALLNLLLAPQGLYQPLDMLTMVGFIILVGTVVNNPILIVEQALVHIREDGMDHRSAIVESVRTRIRPIFMTALIGLFGLLPLVLAPGAGSELYRGLGSVTLGGLVASTVFTLIFVPALFSLALETREAVVQRLWRRRVAEPSTDLTAPHSPLSFPPEL